MNKARFTAYVGIFITLLALVLNWAAPVCVAKSYSISRVEIIATVNPDGSMDVIEDRTWDFKGHLHGSHKHYLLKNALASPTLRYLRGSERYVPGQSGVGTFSYEDVPSAIEVTWRFDAADEERTFRLSYTVQDAVVVYNDVAELYWKFIGADWEVSSENVRVELRLPSSGDDNDSLDGLRAWGHGPLSGEVEIVAPNVIVWTVPLLPAKTFLEGRVVFSLKNLVPEATNRSNTAALNRILTQEEQWAREANKKRQTQAALKVVGPICLGACICAAILIHLRWGKKSIHLNSTVTTTANCRLTIPLPNLGTSGILRR